MPAKESIKMLLLFSGVIFLLCGSFVFASMTGTLRPTGDGGNDSANWSNSGGAACNTTDCYLEVDESGGGVCTNSDGDTSYIETGTNGASQTFNIDLSNIDNGSTITQIDIAVCAIREQGGAAIQTRRCVDGSCTNSGANIDLTNSYAETTQSHTGLNIIKESGTDLEIGVLNNTAKISRVSQISAVITYTTSPDSTAPAAVSDLSSSSVGSTSVTLTWTAPGDDGSVGTAASYDVRYATANITEGNWDSATQASGEPAPSVAGSNESFTVTGLSPETTYYFGVKTSDDSGNESALSNIKSVTTAAEGDNVSPTLIEASTGASPRQIVLRGWAYPGAQIELFQRSIEAENFNSVPDKAINIASDGTFFVQYFGLAGGKYFVGLRISDKDGRSTGLISYALDFSGRAIFDGRVDFFEQTDILVPPTLGFAERTLFGRGTLEVEGYAAPRALISVFIDEGTIATTTASDNGYWNVRTATGLPLGSYNLRTRQIHPDANITSDFSFPKTFTVSELLYPEADFNNDNIINITDWSLFLFRWGSSDSLLQRKVDLNADGVVNITDFSIFLRAMKL